MPGINDAVPYGEDYLVRRVAALEELVATFMSARTLEAATIGAGGLTVQDGGGLTIKDGGSAQVLDGGALKVVNPANGYAVFETGVIPIPDGSGRTQMRTVMRRDEGTVAFAIADYGTVLGHFHLQAMAMFDRAGNPVVADDTISGEGLASPHIHGAGGPVCNTNTTTWPSTTSGTWTTIADGYWEFVNPLLTWQIYLQADTATTGQFRVLVDGTQVDTTQTVTAAFSGWSVGNVARPGSVNIGDVPLVQLQAQRTAGAGTIRAIVRRWAGDQS